MLYIGDLLISLLNLRCVMPPCVKLHSIVQTYHVLSIYCYKDVKDFSNIYFCQFQHTCCSTIDTKQDKKSFITVLLVYCVWLHMWLTLAIRCNSAPEHFMFIYSPAMKQYTVQEKINPLPKWDYSKLRIFYSNCITAGLYIIKITD